MTDVYCPECAVVETSDGPKVRLCAQHAERDRLAADLAEARRDGVESGYYQGVKESGAAVQRERGDRLEADLAEERAGAADLVGDWARVLEARIAASFSKDRRQHDAEMRAGEEHDVAQLRAIGALEADLAAMRGALKRISHGETIPGYHGEHGHPLVAMAQEVIHGAQTIAREALASSPGAEPPESLERCPGGGWRRRGKWWIFTDRPS